MGRLIDKEFRGVRLVGFSLAGEESVIAAPELNVCFDIGRAPREVISIDNVCLSHGHMDHAAGIAYYLSQRNFIGNRPGRVILHRAIAQPVQKLMEVWGDIEGHITPGDIYGVEPLEDVEIRRGLLARPFAANHAGGALGFTLIDVRHKLRPEFHGLPGPAIVQLKRDGVQIEHLVEMPLLTYTGDTALGRFLEHDFVQQSQVLVVECTFFDPDHRSRARAGRHIHVDDLPAILEAAPGAHVVLTHLSRRTDLRAAKRILRTVLRADDVDRVEMFMDRPPRPRASEPAPLPESEPRAERE